MEKTLNLPSAGIFLAVLGTALGQSTIQFTTRTYTVAESAGAVTLTVRRLNDTNTAVNVDYATADGTAINGLKYTAVAGTLAFNAGETNQTILVPILNNGFVDGTNTFKVILSNPINAALGTRTNITVSIIDNDVGLQFQFATYSVSEDAGAVLIGVVRGDDANVPVTVDFGTFNLTATNGMDYLGFTNTLQFALQERLKFVPVTIPNNTLKHPNRTFHVTLSDPVGVSLGTTKTTTVTIMDNDQGFAFEAGSYHVAEDAGVALSAVLRGTDNTNATVTVDVATADNSATNGPDYTGLTNTLSFAPGERRKVVPILILNDGIKEGLENFKLTLSNPTGGDVLGTPTTTTVNIRDNDHGVGFEAGAYTTVWGQAEDFAVNVLRGNDGALEPITVDYAASDLTGNNGLDYQLLPGTLTFQEHETVKSLTIPILRGRSGKTFRVTLSNATPGVTLGTATTTVTIKGDYTTVAPPFDTALTIRREWGVNALTWVGGGQLQRADKPTGPWQTLATATNSCTVQSPVSTTFYRVTRPRAVSLYVPSSYNGQTNMPLVIMLHGYYGNSAFYESYWQIEALAKARGFLYCHPEGTIDRFGYGYWNASEACCDFYNSGVDDAGYLRGLIEEVGRRFAVDRKRVHLVGSYGGGSMAYRMACQSAGLIAGIAALSGTTFLDSDRCQPSEPVNVLNLHATAEEEIFYFGGTLNSTLPYPMPANMPAYPGAMQTVQTWAAYNGAREPITDPTPSMDLDLNVPGLETVVTRYTSYPPGGAVELWTINGGSHVPTLTAEFSPGVIDWLLAHPKP